MGRIFVVTCFGESHGRCVGVVVDGCPPGLKIPLDHVQNEVDKRRPISNEVSTPRREEDKVEILSGVFNDHSTGAPICMLVWNKEAESKNYTEYRWRPRPGHADYTASVKYHTYNDFRGGGRFSGRMTVAFVMAGAIAKLILSKVGIEVYAHTVEIGDVRLENNPSLEMVREQVYLNEMRCADPAIAGQMRDVVLMARKEGDSLGGIVECIAVNVPTGIGEPLFDSLDADLAKSILNIPAVKGVEFGEGFRVSRLKGSSNNDQYVIRNGKIITLTNNAGGILGGISSGMPIVTRVAFKPTPSIAKVQKTVDLKRMVETSLVIKGRHDACVVPRAVPVVESVVAIVLADHLLRSGHGKPFEGSL